MKFSPDAPSKPLRRQLRHETFPLLIASLMVSAQLAACKSAPVPHPGAARASLPHARCEMQSGTPVVRRPASQTSSGTTQPNLITARPMKANGLGEPVLLRPSSTNDIILSATWCPVCIQLEHVLRDPALAPDLRGRNLVFVFVREHEMEGEPEGPETGEHPAALRSYLQYPERIRNLPGQAFLWTDPPPGEMVYFPTVFTTNGSMNGFEWLIKELGVPQETLALSRSRASGRS